MDRIYNCKSSMDEREVTQLGDHGESYNMLTDQVVDKGGKGCVCPRRRKRSRRRRCGRSRSRSRRHRRRRAGCRPRSRRSRRRRSCRRRHRSRRSMKRSCSCKSRGRRRRRRHGNLSTNPFIIFYLEQYFKCPGRPVTAVARQAGKKWCAMSEDKKQKYIRMANRSRGNCKKRRR